MQIFIKTITGKAITIEAEPDDSIESFKSKIQDKEGIPLDHQLLTYGGRMLGIDCCSLQDFVRIPQIDAVCCTLKDYDIKNGGTIHLIFKTWTGIELLYSGEEHLGLLTLKTKKIFSHKLISRKFAEWKSELAMKTKIPMTELRLVCMKREFLEKKFKSIKGLVDKRMVYMKQSTNRRASLSPLLVDKRFEVSNGVVGMRRFTVLHMCNLIAINDKSLRTVFGLCNETFSWKGHPYFARERKSYFSEGLVECKDDQDIEVIPSIHNTYRLFALRTCPGRGALDEQKSEKKE